jgi:uracil-DNA glycosylase
MKTIIIGQAPPAVKQDLPYDTTALYDWLEAVGVSKEKAQEIIEFEACYHTFLGYDAKGGHKKPTYKHFEEHWVQTLRNKVKVAENVILVGSVARDFMMKKLGYTKKLNWGEIVTLKHGKNRKFTVLPHPSKRNTKLHNEKKEIILKTFEDFFGNVK